MSKAKLSTIVAKQFPEFVREDYPTFIAFVEAYYEFLQQSSYDLTEIRDLDKTLDSFVEHFKSEVAANVPNMLMDERQFLQRLKDSYLAKGTEASYKLLFRLLYNKEVVVDYPGKQMLRTSDGRWSQDVTIFARVKRGDPSLVLGQYIEVITPTKIVNIRVDNWRWATVYVNGVAQVSNNIVELFIDRKFYGNINYHHIIKYDAVFEAEILPTTSNVKVITRGVGFKAGQLYRIKSALGDGSILKISRVTETGGIQSAQLIKFGVGYQTDFTTTISPPSADTFTPLTIIGDNITVNDKTGGFVESGLITQNDYTTDAWISTYNGKVLREFYYDDAQVPDPENAAQLKFTLGPLAKYPGYYTSNLGFLSDAIYVQDGHYYQAFSYLLKIDERISKYRDIVKSLIHPAGMALFGGYELKNELNVTPEIISILAFLAYKFETLMDSPVDEISTKGIGKALDEYQQVLESISEKGFSKALSDVLDTPSDASVLLVSKTFTEIVSQPTDTNIKDFGKSLTETANTSEVVSAKEFEKSLTETSFASESNTIALSKSLSDSTTISEASTSFITKPLSDFISAPTDSNVLLIQKSLDEIILSSEVIDVIEVSKSLTDTLSPQTDSLVSSFSKALSDNLSSPTDDVSSSVGKSLSDSYSTTDEISTVSLNKPLTDVALSSDDISSVNLTKALTDSFTQTDLIGVTISKEFFDSVTVTELIVDITPEFTLTESVSSPIDAISSISSTKSLTDTFSPVELLGISLVQDAKQDTVEQSDVSLITINKGISDSTTTNESGSIELNPYVDPSFTYIVSNELYVGERITF